MSEVFDISAYHATGSTLAKYTDLTAALDSNNGGGVPQSFQKGGMRIQFVRTSDNKYVQWRLMADEFSAAVADWQGVDDEPTAGSTNLVESGGVYPLTRLYNAPKIVLGSFEDGYALFFNGTSAVKQASSGSSITQFSVVGEKKIHLENFYAAGNRSVCVYDSNNSLIDCIIYQSSNTSTDYILPGNADYVIATVNTANKSQFYVEYVYPITDDLQKIKSDVDAKYNSIESEIDDLYERELSLGTIIQGKYVVWYGAYTPVNGTEITDSDCVCTDFIPVKTGFKVKMSGLWLKDNRSVCAYDKDKQFVEGVIRNTQVVSEYEYTIPSGVAYIRMSGKVGQDLSAVYIDHPITKDIERLEKEIDLSFGNIYGKKWLFLGDSITHESFKTDHPEYGWVTHFQNYVKAAKIVNVSVDGAHWKDYADTGDYDGNPQYANLSQNVIGNQCEKIIRGKDTTNPNYSYVEDYQDFDFIIVAAGTNDGNTTADDTTYFDEQFGHYENSEWVKTPIANVNRQLFPGIMRYVYEKFITLYPNARIFYCTPVQAFYGRRTYEGIMNIGDMVKKVCSRLSDVTAIDTEKCGIYGNFELDEEMGRDLYDGLHTNENGGKKIAKYNYCAIKDSVSGY